MFGFWKRRRQEGRAVKRREGAEKLRVRQLEDRITPSGAALPHPFSSQFFTQNFQPTDASYFAGNIAGDGTNALIAMDGSGNWWVDPWNGQPYNAGPAWSPASSWSALFEGDFNGDNITDVAGFGQNGSWWVGLSNGSTLTTSQWAQWPAANTFQFVVVGDFTGNGRTDVAGLSTNGTWWVGLSTGSSFVTSQWGSWSGSWSQVLVGDFNGDGKADVAGMGVDGSWWVGLSTGTSFNTGFWGQWLPPGNYQTILTGYFTQSGMSDVAGFSTNGTWYVGLSTGTSFQTSPWGTWSGTWSQVFVGDFNGDGAYDVAGLGIDGSWWVGLSTGSSFNTGKWAQWSPASDWQAIVVGDFDGLGRAEVAGLGENMTWWIGFSNGSSFNTEVWSDWVSTLSFPTSSTSPWWNPSFSENYFNDVSSSLKSELYFNTENSFNAFVGNYLGVIRTWSAEATAAGATGESALEQYFQTKLTNYFTLQQSALAAQYPGLTQQQYQLLMIMNLVHGTYEFGYHPVTDTTLVTLLASPVGDCTEEATLVSKLAGLMGITGSVVELKENFTPSVGGNFQAGHVVFVADGLWIDAETNMALAFNLNMILALPPTQRMQDLLNANMVYGFYNWLLTPAVRLDQINNSEDGGVIQFYYPYYLEGLGQGTTVLVQLD